MKTRCFYLGFATAALLVAVLALGCSASTANIGDAWMARDYEGTQRTTTFGPSEVFYCVAELKNAPDDTTVKASWTAVSVEGVEPNTFIDETAVTSGSGSLHFELSNSSLWPNGQYKVDLYLNDELDRTLEFEVR
jgi:hypothetical protein